MSVQDEEEKSEKIVPLTVNQRHFCVFVEQIFRLHNQLPTADLLDSNDRGLGLHPVGERGYWARYYNDKRVQEYLKGVGVDIVKLMEKSNVVTPLQLLTINTLLDFNDKRSDSRKLKELGVATKDYQAWLSDPAFKAYFSDRVQKMLDLDAVQDVDRALYERAISGDTKAIQYFNEFTGRYRPADKDKDIDVGLLIIRILETLQRHLGDQPDKLTMIARELESFAAVDFRKIDGSRVVKGIL
jgi:hypothetical protein